MADTEKNVLELNIKNLLSDTGLYIIPRYQRNYAWGEAQIRQLIRDVIDSLPKENTSAKKYYLGTLIVDKTTVNGVECYETIDGQQRLTTLNIIATAIKFNSAYQHIDMKWLNSLNLKFTNRNLSTKALDILFKKEIASGKYNTAIIEAYQLANKILKEELAENNVKIESFTEYLFENVTILRVAVPPKTDLNHYFEIMNNRGEQLEKHEVLKAKLLEPFIHIQNTEEKEKSNQLFHDIWEACANMEKYVQYGFSVNNRNNLFGNDDWDNFSAQSFEDLLASIKYDEDLDRVGKGNNLTIDEIIDDNSIIEEVSNNNRNENPDRFYPVINFSNFLLHVLRIQKGKDIPLDDKRLLEVFQQVISDLEGDVALIEFSKDFAFNLLKLKFLFDKYIIKRDTSSEKESWSLLRLKCYEGNKGNYVNTFEGDENRKLIMLLSMFHVSIPTLSYKYWLNASLKYVFENPKTTGESYISYLEEIAKQFVYNRIIAKTSQEYYDLIYNRAKLPSIKWGDNEEECTIDLSKFQFNEISNNLLFNYVDYLLWKNEILKHQLDSRIKDFKFTSRSSVEHFYPQNPKEGFPKLEDNSILDSFGNLCLISRSKNSSLSNFSPLSKKEFYLKGDIDSIKQYIMIREAENWDSDAITRHKEYIFEVLKQAI